MKNKVIISAILTFCIISFSNTYLSAAEIYLNDGRILYGQITGITKNRILLDRMSDRLTVSQNDITAVMNTAESDSPTAITIRYNDAHTEYADLVLLTKDVLIYKTRNDIDTMHQSSRSDIAEITVSTHIANKSDRQTLKLNDTSDILGATGRLLSDETDDNDISSIENSDFYDRYWLRFNGRINKTTGNLLWNLIDLYTEKEKNLSLIYNELLSNDKDKTEIKIASISQELHTRIQKLRTEFANRAYIIIARQTND